MQGFLCFAVAFCADQDNADGAVSDLETNAGWSNSEESGDSESDAAGGTPSPQKHRSPHGCRASRSGLAPERDCTAT